MIGRWRRTWQWGTHEYDLTLFTPRRGWGWAFGLALQYEPHTGERTWQLTLGPVQLTLLVVYR